MKIMPLSILFLSVLILHPGCSTTPSISYSPESAAEAFSRFSSLEGDWNSTPDPSDMPPSIVNYRTIANGSAVVETVFKGTPFEMSTVIFLDGDRLLMTHYCAARNQPHMKASEVTRGSVYFVTDHVTNHLDPGDLYMGEAEWIFTDENHLTTRWRTFQDGEAGDPHIFNMTRID